MYTIGEDVLPGYWRGTLKADNCYWEVTIHTGRIADNHFGVCNGILFVPEWAANLVIDGGTYIYCGPSMDMCPR